MVVQRNTVLFFLAYLLIAAHVQAESTAATPRIDDTRRAARENQIFDSLFDQSSSKNLFWVRPPAQDGHNATEVTISLGMVDLVDIDEARGKMEVMLWISLIWKDSRLAWSSNATNPDEPVKSLRVPLDLIWSPDLTAYDSQHISEERDEDTTHGIRAMVRMDGQVSYFPRHRYRMSCDFDLEQFPRDNAECNLTLGLWTYTGNEVNISNGFSSEGETPKKFDVQDLKNHSDWSITAQYYHKVDSEYSEECCPQLYQDIHIEYKLKRNPTFFVEAYVVAPLMLAALLPLIHILPPDNPAKINVAVISCLGVIIMAATFVTNIPASHPPGKRPAIMTAYLYGIMLFIISIVVSCITASISHSKHTTYRIHSCFRRLLDSCLVRKLCCLGDMAKYYQQNSAPVHLNIREDQEEIMNGDALANHHEKSGEGIEVVVKFLKEENNRKQLEREWYQVAVIIDRTAAIAFVLLFIIETLM